MIPTWRVIRPGSQQISASALNAAFDEIGRIMNASATAPLHLDVSASGLHFWLDTDCRKFNFLNSDHITSVNDPPPKLARATTIAALPSYSRTDNVITLGSLAALDYTILDGVNVRLGDRILLNSGQGTANSAHKDYGVYKITSMPSVTAQIVRHGDITNAIPQIQSIVVDGASGGTFTLTFDSTDGGSPLTTAAIAWNASAATIETALENLANITDVSVTGSGTAADPFLVTFNDSCTDYLLLTGNVCKTLTVAGLTPSSSITLTRSQDAEVSSYLPAGTLVVVTEGPGPGAYDNAHAYVAGNCVSYNGFAYQSISGSTGVLPTNPLSWNLFDRSGYTDTLWELESDDTIILNRSPLHWKRIGVYYAGTNVSLSGTYDEIINSTDTTQVIVDKNGTLVGTRQELNFIEGNGIAITAVDNVGATRIDLTFAIQSGATISSLTITNLTSTSITTTNATVTGDLDASGASSVEINNTTITGSTVITGTVDAGGATSVELPNGTSVTTNTAGEVAIDTNGDGTNVTQGVIQYYDGTQVMYVIAVDGYPTTNGDTIVYNSSLHKWVIAAPGAGTVTIEGDSGGPQSGPAFVFTTDVGAWTAFSFVGGSDTLTLRIPYADGINHYEGIVSDTDQDLSGWKTWHVTTSTTNNFSPQVGFRMHCSGTVATGFGSQTEWFIDGSMPSENAAQLRLTWVTVDSVVQGTFYLAGGEPIWGGQNNSGNPKIGFLGNATSPVAPSTFTQTYSTATTTLNAYTSDPESSSYSGIDNTQGGTPYAQVSDLNSLRTAYENLRTSYDNLIQFVNGIVDKIQAYGLFT